MEGRNSLGFHFFGGKEEFCVRGGTRSAGLEPALQGEKVMPWSSASVVPPLEADEGTGIPLQLNKTLQGVTFGEQQPKGTPGKGLGSVGSHTASGPLSSCALAAFHQGVGIRLEGVCGKAAPHRLPGNTARVT